MMKFILKFVGSRLSGYKTYGAGIGLILLAILHYINLLWPGTIPQIPPADVSHASTEFTGGIALIGVGHKGNKIIDSINSMGGANGQPGSLGKISPEQSNTAAGAGPSVSLNSAS